MLNAIDLFSGCGGLSEGLRKAGFNVKVGVEIDKNAAIAYRLNHKETCLLSKDISQIDITEIQEIIGNNPIHLLAGCPPCQGFSAIRRRNKKGSAKDKRNKLILEYLRFVRELLPLTIMMENVPGLLDYFLFADMVKELKIIGYNISFDVVDVKSYGVPQSRKRLILVGSRLGAINIVRGSNSIVTVRNAFRKLTPSKASQDPLHQIRAKHSTRIQRLISLVPKNGGSRKDLPQEFVLDCHKKDDVGFNDVYGRLRWDDYSTTITGGCLNPSKGRFLHPEEDRCISPREAALLQSFGVNYKFPLNIPKSAIALLIGNALPPKFSYIQACNIKSHIEQHLQRENQ